VSRLLQGKGNDHLQSGHSNSGARKDKAIADPLLKDLRGAVFAQHLGRDKAELDDKIVITKHVPTA
jgi:hypothetical protein